MADNEMKLGLILSATDRMSRVINQATRNAADKFKKLNSSISAVNDISNRMLVTGGVLAAGIYQSVLAAEDGAASEKKLENVFKTMWGNNGEANKAGKAASDYAEKLSLMIGVEDDLIRTTQAKLATFSNVSNKTGMMSGVFDRATRASYDMASVGFGEASQNAVILGKALESPMTGIKALKKQGTLTDKDIISIQSIYKSKGLLEAQKAILNAVERQVKGTGMATVKATDLMKIGFGKITEAIGGVFLPTVEEAQKGVISFLQPTIDWINNNHSLIKTIAKVLAGLLAFAVILRIITTIIKVANIVMAAWNVGVGITAFLMKGSTAAIETNAVALNAYVITQKAAAAGQWVLNAATAAYNAILAVNPIVWVIAGIAALIAVIIICWKKFAAFRAVIKTTWDVIKGFGIILKDYVLDRIKGIISGVGSLGQAIGLLFKGKFSEAFDTAKKGVRELSGYDAKVKALQRSKALVSNISTNYKNTLASEKAKQESKSMNGIEANRNAVMSQSSSSNQKLVYSPTINIQGTSTGDLTDLKKTLSDNKREMWQFMTKINQGNDRVSFAKP